MILSTVSNRVVQWYLAAIDESKPDRIRCHYLVSPPGRGKTSVLKAAAGKIGKALNKNIGYVVVSGPMLTPSDVLGYLVPVKHPDGRATSKFTEPFFFITDEGKHLTEYDGGIIIFDEADKMDTDVKKVVGEGALSGRFGPHRLPNTWVVWMAGNRAEDRSGSTKELDHLINRRAEHHIIDDVESWITWCEENGVSHITIAFGKNYPHIVFPEKLPEKQGPYCTPRSVVMLDSYLQSISVDGVFPDDGVTIEEATGIIGGPAAAQLFSMVRLDREMPKFEEIIKTPGKTRVPDKADAQMLVCYNLAHRVGKDTIEPVITYVNRMPKEFAVTFAVAAARRQPMLVMEPAFHKWTMDNSSLMAAIAR